MKKEIKTELTKEKIMAAAMAEFGENGYAAASINNIICNAGISKGLLYHNFENKDALYLACIKQCFTELLDYLKKQDISVDIHRYMDARLHYFQQHKEDARLFFEAILQPPVHLKEQISDLKEDFDEFNRELYKKLLSSVSLREGVSEADAMNYFILIQNMFNGYFSSPAFRSMSFSDVMTSHEANLSKLLDFMLYGIAERDSLQCF